MASEADHSKARWPTHRWLKKAGFGSHTLQKWWTDPFSWSTSCLGFSSALHSLAYPMPTALFFFFFFSKLLFLFTSLHRPRFSLHFSCFFVCITTFFLFAFSVTSILRWGRRNKNNNRFPYSFHFLDQRWLSNRGGEFRAAFDAQYWCWLSMKISLCYIWANYQRSVQLTWDAPTPCEAM